MDTDDCRCRKSKKSTADDKSSSSSSSSSWTEKSDNDEKGDTEPKEEQENAKHYAKGTIKPSVCHLSDVQCTVLYIQ